MIEISFNVHCRKLASILPVFIFVCAFHLNANGQVTQTEKPKDNSSISKELETPFGLLKAKNSKPVDLTIYGQSVRILKDANGRPIDLLINGSRQFGFVVNKDKDLLFVMPDKSVYKIRKTRVERLYQAALKNSNDPQLTGVMMLGEDGGFEEEQEPEPDWTEYWPPIDIAAIGEWGGWSANKLWACIAACQASQGAMAEVCVGVMTRRPQLFPHCVAAAEAMYGICLIACYV